jgi:hypothetical protein
MLVLYSCLYSLKIFTHADLMVAWVRVATDFHLLCGRPQGSGNSSGGICLVAIRQTARARKSAMSMTSRAIAQRLPNTPAEWIMIIASLLQKFKHQFLEYPHSKKKQQPRMGLQKELVTSRHRL